MKTKLNYFAIALVFLSMFAILIFKANHVDGFVYSLTGEKYLGGMRVVINDAIIYSGIFAFFGLSYFHKMPYILSIALRCLAFGFLAIYVVDFYLITNFNTHLNVTDAVKYSSYSLKYLQQIYGRDGLVIPLLATAGLGFALFVLFSRFRTERKLIIRSFSISSVALLLLSVFSYGASEGYIHSWIYKNVISHNFVIYSEAKAYSDNFVKKFSYTDDENVICNSNVPKQPNIILLMIESLSSYQSNYFSGIKNWTPNLDAIAQKNWAYNNFYANGFTTEDGEISLLTGKLPIYEPSTYSNGGGMSFNGFYNIKESLPNILKKNGYSTSFLTTADLEFANTGEWAKSIGFEYVEGHKHVYYDLWERFHFNAAPDEALYNRVTNRVSSIGKDKYFIFIKTVSTHHPFRHPETKNISEAETFQYADKQLGAFYDKLMKMGFFENGMLIIVGDHRAMIPLKNEEMGGYGSLKASAKVPMVIAYGNKSHYLDRKQYQQTDIFGSLKGLLSDTRCHSSWVGDVLERKSAKYIAHRRGDSRNIISVFSGEETALVMLDGDDTRIESKYPESEQVRNLMINKINSIRINKSHYK